VDHREHGKGREQTHAGGAGGGARHQHRPNDDHVGQDQDQGVRQLAREGGRHDQRLDGEAGQDERDRGGVDRPQEADGQPGPAAAELPRGEADDQRRRVQQGRSRVDVRRVVRTEEGGDAEERSRDREGDLVEEGHPVLQEGAAALGVEGEGGGAAETAHDLGGDGHEG